MAEFTKTVTVNCTYCGDSKVVKNGKNSSGMIIPSDTWGRSEQRALFVVASRCQDETRQQYALQRVLDSFKLIQRLGKCKTPETARSC